jgi:nicotinate-nucleotide pyrophosphorylase (carboxylating)
MKFKSVIGIGAVGNVQYNLRPVNLLELSPSIIREAASRALGEDRGPADLTTMAAVPAQQLASAAIVAREPGVVSGMALAAQVFSEVDITLIIAPKVIDGQKMAQGTSLLEVKGSAAAILTAERTALNFLQHLSGIATQTRRFADAVGNTKAIILDTRKTTPGLRHLEKYAVRCGGGLNHRFGLYDQFLFKDNHLQCLGGVSGLSAAVQRARHLDPTLKIEIEADTLEQVRFIAELGVDIILLDNMTIDEMRAAVTIINGRAKIEASGNMTLSRVAEVADTGVDYISVGALTHTVKAIDLSLELELL